MSLTSSSFSELRVAVIGAGVIGMCCALSLADRGVRVTLIERNIPGRGASWASAGMLAPAFEAAAEEGVHPSLFELCMEGAEIWKSFAPRLQALTGRTLDYGDPGAIACAYTQEQGEHLFKVASACESRGVPHTRLETLEAQKLEPALSNDLLGALELPTDQQVDNWAVLEGLGVALERAGVEVRSGAGVSALDGHSSAFRLDAAPGQEFDRVVWAIGESARSKLIYEGEEISLAEDGAVLPVKGQMLSISPSNTAPKRVLRFGSGYVAPKASRIVIGSTSEWGRDGTDVELDVIDLLRRNAAQICPVLAQGQITQIWAGVRPGTPDHAPLIGKTALDGVYIATGHYRNGILLGPITGELITDLIVDNRSTELVEAFSVKRFAARLSA